LKAVTANSKPNHDVVSSFSETLAYRYVSMSCVDVTWLPCYTFLIHKLKIL